MKIFFSQLFNFLDQYEPKYLNCKYKRIVMMLGQYITIKESGFMTNAQRKKKASAETWGKLLFWVLSTSGCEEYLSLTDMLPLSSL